MPAEEQAPLGQLLVLPPAGECEEEGCPLVQVMSAFQLLAYADLQYKGGPPAVLYTALPDNRRVYVQVPGRGLSRLQAERILRVGQRMPLCPRRF